jgi:hypothetical protein
MMVLKTDEKLYFFRVKPFKEWQENRPLALGYKNK